MGSEENSLKGTQTEIQFFLVERVKVVVAVSVHAEDRLGTHTIPHLCLRVAAQMRTPYTILR